MNNTVYTIGYSGFSINTFITVLKQHGIRLVIDVRSSPYSGFYPDFNMDTLKPVLLKNGIYYRNYAEEFGARQKNESLFTPEGYLDFDLHCKSKPFIQGVNKLINSLSQGYTFALMCAEKDPIRCHRTIMVSRRFFEMGYHIVHILPNGILSTQQDIEQELLDKYFPDRDQATFFTEPQSDKQLIPQAYKLQNAEIGYRMEEET